MIIETPYKANDTVTLKTSAGEEIVARFIEQDTNSITITKPLALMASQQGVGLGPWVFTTDPQGKIKLNISNVLFVAKTEESMAKQYVTSVSGIAMV